MEDKTRVEVEVKIPVKEDLDQLHLRLQEIGFVHTKTLQEDDIYFNSDAYDLRKQDKALRVRTTKDLSTGKEWAELNCKGPKLDHVSMSRKELEIRVEDPDSVLGILEELGFLPVSCKVKKTRCYFYRGRITAAADKVEGLGAFLELEIIEQGERKREECLKELESVMNELGYKLEDTVRTSYLSMLEKGMLQRIKV